MLLIHMYVEKMKLISTKYPEVSFFLSVVCDHCLRCCSLAYLQFNKILYTILHLTI